MQVNNVKNLFNSRGGIPIVLLWSIVFFVVIILCTFVVERYFLNVKAEVVKDQLTFSALAVYKNIDKSQLQTKNITLTDEMKDTFKKYLIKNMGLNDDLSSKTNSVASGKVEIDYMKIYQINDNEKNYPDGSLIAYKPSLYVRIKYDIEPILKGILGNKKTVYTSAVVELN